MSIVRMKRLRLIAMTGQRRALMSDLLRLGCVEITEPEAQLADPEWTVLLGRSGSDLSAVKADSAALSAALDALQKYAPVKSGLFPRRKGITETAFFDPDAAARALECAREIGADTAEIGQILSRKNQLSAQRESLLPWRTLPLDLSLRETAELSVVLGVCPIGADVALLQRELQDAVPLAELSEVSSDKQQHYLLLLAHQSALEAALDALKPHSFPARRRKIFSAWKRSSRRWTRGAPPWRPTLPPARQRGRS